jgi:RNA polymerase-associated protein CTR9
MYVLPLAVKVTIVYGELVFQAAGSKGSLPPVYSLLANIQLARARKAPKLVLQDPGEPPCMMITMRSRSSSVVVHDDLRQERHQADYHRAATQYMNDAERAVGQAAAESSADEDRNNAVGTLTFLTRGIYFQSCPYRH